MWGYRIQEEREERHKRKKTDSGGGHYGDLDTPLSGRSSKTPPLILLLLLVESIW